MILGHDLVQLIHCNVNVLECKCIPSKNIQYTNTVKPNVQLISYYNECGYVTSNM